jgi:multiple sugar transport system permease protein
MATISRSSRNWDIATYAVLILLAIFCLFPIVWTFLTSIKVEADIVTQTMVYIPNRFTFDHYVKIWSQSDYPVLVFNSLVVTSITVVICMLTGTVAAYSFSRFAYPGRSALMLGYLIVRMFPAVLMIIPLFVLMRNVGLLDSKLGLAIAYTSFLLPLFVWMMKGFFDAAPKELESAARIDGGTRFSAMWQIVVPITRNGLVATSVFVAIAACSR